MKTCRDCIHHIGENDCEVNEQVAYHVKAETCPRFDQKLKFVGEVSPCRNGR